MSSGALGILPQSDGQNTKSSPQIRVFVSAVKGLKESPYALSEAISSLGCRRNSSSGSMLIRQLTEAQLLTSFKTATWGLFSVHWTGCHLSQLH